MEDASPIRKDTPHAQADSAEETQDFSKNLNFSQKAERAQVVQFYLLWFSL